MDVWVYVVIVLAVIVVAIVAWHFAQHFARHTRQHLDEAVVCTGCQKSMTNHEWYTYKKKCPDCGGEDTGSAGQQE